MFALPLQILDFQTSREEKSCMCGFVCFCLLFRSLSIVIFNSVLSMLQKIVDFRFLPVCLGRGHAQWPPTFWDLLDCSSQAPLSVGSSRQEDWSGLPFPPPGFFPTQRSNLHLLHWQADSLPLGHMGSPRTGEGSRSSASQAEFSSQASHFSCGYWKKEVFTYWDLGKPFRLIHELTWIPC